MKPDAQRLFQFAQDVRRELHRHPELGFQEIRTAGIIAGELSWLGIEVQTGVAKTGVVGLLDGGKGNGPVVLLRFDMDALPIQEETGVSYASEIPGIMHACGHDGHVAIGLTVARMLSEIRQELRGVVKFVFQPAEEGLGGAEAMIRDGVLENPRPDVALAIHLWNEKPVGWYGVTEGPLMAGADLFKVRILGKGGHGALPHQAIDPIATSASIIQALQTIVSRNVSPLNAAVLSITRVRAGEAYNIIPQEVELGGTIRTFDPEVRKLVLTRFEETIRNISTGMQCRAEVEVTELTPPVVNHPEVANRVKASIENNLPGSRIEPDCRTMVSEDMAFILREVPGCYILVGSANPDAGLSYSHHHPKFDFDESAMVGACELMTGVVREWLG
ncbi:amidohydrolase [Anaerolinea thermolimosa]|uniref:M20 metallopeptidase family protein n=1 Tax=Anaerolinea thermolimosa TaxID=229919 RepID=UPI00078486BF|nr:amidohydrolase [Anaerolinea thermolimosa]GAP06604.1 amidohydrolase [Anaerolinea thermolimosa]